MGAINQFGAGMLMVLVCMGLAFGVVVADEPEADVSTLDNALLDWDDSVGTEPQAAGGAAGQSQAPTVPEDAQVEDADDIHPVSYGVIDSIFSFLYLFAIWGYWHPALGLLSGLVLPSAAAVYEYRSQERQYNMILSIVGSFIVVLSVFADVASLGG